MFTDINRIAELAKEDPKRQFYSMAHLITGEKLYEAFRSLRKDASAGIDGVTYQQYETNAEENIRQLHQRLKEGKYRAQPLRRVYIPKEDGKQRPISIPVLEDKIVQKAAVGLLNAIYEQDFLDCSYGFRPGRGQHQALDEVGRMICTRPIGWILEIDIRSYFDSIVRSALVEMIESTRWHHQQSGSRRLPLLAGASLRSRTIRLHICTRSRQGRFTVHVKTIAKRLGRGLKAIWEWCKQHRHDAVNEQQKTLNAKLRGHYQYYGRRTNYRAIRQFYQRVRCIWREWLSRRTRGKQLTWERFAEILRQYPLLLPRITQARAGAGSRA